MFNIYVAAGLISGMILHLVDLYSRVTLYRALMELLEELNKIIKEQENDETNEM